MQEKVEVTHQEPPPHDVSDVEPIPPLSPHWMHQDSSDMHDAETRVMPAWMGSEMVQLVGKMSG